MDIKTYQKKNKINKFSLIYIKSLNMIEKENSKHSVIYVNDIKNEKLKEKLNNLSILIKEIKDKKVNDFEELLEKNYKFKNVLLERHFFFKAFQEINEELTKNKEGFLVDFTNKLRSFFDKQTLFYWEEKGCFNYDNNTLYINLAKEDLYYLDLVIKAHASFYISNFKKIGN